MSDQTLYQQLKAPVDADGNTQIHVLAMTGNIDELKQIIGIGPRFAYDLVKKDNIKSINELIKAYDNHEIELNNQIVLGLKYHNVYKQKIPREEINDTYTFLLEREIKEGAI